MIKIKIPKKTNYEDFFRKKGLDWLLLTLKDGKKLPTFKQLTFKQLHGGNINLKKNTPHLPNLKDLYNLYQFIILNNRTTVLEYGCGWSTLIMHLALMENKKRFKNKAFKRCEKPYELISIDCSKKFIKICKERIKKYSNNFNMVNFNFSNARMTTFNNRYCTEYTNHPQVIPDLIYIDGPSPFSIKNKIENFTTNSHGQMPMLCDILKFEHFLTPGTLIIMDGRTANARFLKSNFQRKWKHLHNAYNDHHYFWLNEGSLGMHNTEQLKFYLKK